MFREKNTGGRSRWLALLTVLFVLLLAQSASVPQVSAADIGPMMEADGLTTSVLSLDPDASGGRVAVPLGKTQFMKVHAPYREVTVGDPEIADVVALSGTSLYVVGKQVGTTNLTLMDAGGNVMTVVDLVVTFDVEGLKAKMHELAPGDLVEVRPAGQSVVLSGRVSSADRLRQLVAVAEQYAPGKVTNMLGVSGSQQVMLKVRFAEVQRSVLKNLGFSNSLAYAPNDDLFQVASGNGLNPDRFFAGLANVLTGDFTLSSVMDALENKGMVRTLAEPNIIALSGDKAEFLAGGEFPIPIAQEVDSGNTTITVEFKKFGVGLSFTPTVLAEDTINLQLDAEVSSIDPSVSVQNGTLTIPGLKIRRANTTVELRDGQSFAIAGLIEDNFEDTVDAIPGLASIPILGVLASSKDFQRRQTELVVIVEAHLVQPTVAEALATPTDRTIPP